MYNTRKPTKIVTIYFEIHNQIFLKVHQWKLLPKRVDKNLDQCFHALSICRHFIDFAIVIFSFYWPLTFSATASLSI